MPYYIPDYSDNTYVKLSEPMQPADVVARHGLMRELGMVVVDEPWVKGKGYVPKWYCPKALTQDEMNLLCLCEYPTQQHPLTTDI